MTRYLRIKMIFIFLIICILMSICIFAQPNEDKDQCSKLRFLVGEWISVDSGQAQKGEGTFEFKFELNENILIRTNTTVLPAKTSDTGPTVHEDLLIVYPSGENSSLKAIYFDNEKHIIHYSVLFPENKTGVIFESENNAKAPRFRLTYEKESNGMLLIDFSIAPPGSSYKTYLKGFAKLKDLNPDCEE